jgi:diguanylate cyclase (GGDEF)-like protein
MSERLPANPPAGGGAHLDAESRPAAAPARRAGGLARSILGVILLATVLPVLVMAGAGASWFRSESQRQLEDRLALENRQWAAVLQQRLAAAEAVVAGLGHAPAAGGWPDHAVPGVLTDWARVSAVGQLIAGSGQAWQSWQRAPSAESSDGTGADAARLRWLPAPLDSQEPARVMLRVALPDGSHLVAGIEPRYLWPDIPGASAVAEHCVTDGRERILRCPAAVRVPALAADADHGPHLLSRQLYWGEAFGAGPWRITSVASPDLLAQADHGLLWRGMVAAATLSLLLAAGLGWTQWRRVSASLNRLIEGTQRWSEQDWEARVAVRAGDELGRLAQALNHMAQRIGQQVRAIQVQTAIDREILAGPDTARVMALVVQRMQALLPDAQVAVLVAGEAQAVWRSHRPDREPLAVVVPSQLPMLSPGEWAGCLRPGARWPSWLLEALGLAPGQGSHLVWVPVIWHDKVVAQLLVASQGGCDMPDEVCRELAELRDRLAVTLASMARETALLERAVQDGLTGLLNRNGLHDAIDVMLARGRPFTLVLVDLDRFKEVNDTLGHQAGDELLCAVAGRLRACVSPQARIARPGGDEFVLLLPGAREDATACAVAICAELARPFALRGVQQQIGGSLGLSAFPDQAGTRGELMRRADLAMYVSKGEGRGRFSWYTEVMDERVAHRNWMAKELRVAIDSAHFELFFQPRVEAQGGRMVCAEVLLRWPHAERGMISPAEFVPAAEEAGLIDKLGAWVLATAFEQMGQWRTAGLPLQRIAVNVSHRQLKAPDFAGMVLGLLNRFGLRPQDVELELTESIFAEDVDAVCRVLEPLRQAGILLALDDFGTGYSSLSSLYRLPVDVIKIDHSFVVDLGKRPSAAIMARSIVALSKALSKRVVAEGVETRAQRDHLLSLDCDELQGYLYGQPMRATELVQHLQRDAEAAAPAAAQAPRARSQTTVPQA